MTNADLVIIGAGAAGLTAAATAACEGITVLVIEHLAPGGQVATVDKIRNFPGFPDGVGGYELGPLLQQQAEEAGAQFLLDSVERISRDDGGFLIGCAEKEVHAGAVIFAAGSRRRTLDVPGEAELEGRGVSHCASCDGHFFRGKAVIVAGGGDSAFDEAEVLAEQAERVTIVHHDSAPTAQRRTVERVTGRSNVHLLADAEIVAIEGSGEVQTILIDLPDGRRSEPAAGVFIYVGLIPNSDLVAGLAEIDGTGRIVTDAQFQTACPGLFVAGDVRAGATALLSSAAGDGAGAAVASVQYLRRRTQFSA